MQHSLCQSVTNTFFFKKYKYQILFGFQKSPNTKYWILFGIKKIQIPNTEYYTVSRKFEYRIRIVLFGLTIRIPNTKYRIVYNILEKWNYNKDICPIQDILFWKYVKLFGHVFGLTIWIPEYYTGCQKTQIPNTEYYSVLRKSEYRIRILLFGPTIRIVFEYRIIRHTLASVQPSGQSQATCSVCAALHSTHCTALYYTALYTLHYTTLHCTHCTVLHCTVHTALYTLHCTHCTVHTALYTLHCTHCTALFNWTELYKLHSTALSLTALHCAAQESTDSGHPGD